LENIGIRTIFFLKATVAGFGGTAV